MKLKEIGAKNDMPRGWIRKSTVNNKIYVMWIGMLRRVYDKWEYYKECTVHSDFFLLSNFVKWIEKEPNYPLLVEDPGCNKWTIDKDGIIEGNKEYAPGKIRLITNSDNAKEKNIRCGHPTQDTEVVKRMSLSQHRKPVLSVSLLNNDVHYYQGVKEVQKLLGISASNIVKCCKGKYNQCKGYKWFYATDLLGLMNYLYKGWF